MNQVKEYAGLPGYEDREDKDSFKEEEDSEVWNS